MLIILLVNLLIKLLISLIRYDSINVKHRVKEAVFMPSVVSAIQNTIPISHFNRGLAGKIFDEVKTSGAKVVMKNNVAECVLLSPDEYVRLMDEVNDARLLAVAAERMSSFDPSTLVSEEEMDKKLGITEKELDSVGEVEFE